MKLEENIKRILKGFEQSAGKFGSKPKIMALGEKEIQEVQLILAKRHNYKLTEKESEKQAENSYKTGISYFFEEKVISVPKWINADNLNETQTMMLIKGFSSAYQENIGYDPSNFLDSNKGNAFMNKLMSNGHSDYVMFKVIEENPTIFPDVQEKAREYKNIINKNLLHLQKHWWAIDTMNNSPHKNHLVWASYAAMPYFERHANNIKDANEILLKHPMPKDVTEIVIK